MGKKSRNKKIRRDLDSKAEGRSDTASIKDRGLFTNTIFNSRAIIAFAILVFIITVYLYYPTKGDDYDIWWHLKYGEHFLKDRTWNIDHSQFSWTPTASDWKYVTWLSDIIFYLIYKTASSPGLFVVQLFIFLSIFALYFIYIRINKETIAAFHIAALMLVIVALALLGTHIKPERFTDLFFAAIVFVYFYAKTTRRSLFFLYPAIFLIWVNMHGGFIMGLVFISFVLIFEAFNYLFVGRSALDRRLAVHLAIGVLASYLATSVNPYGIDFIPAVIKKFFSSENMLQAQHNTSYASLWLFLKRDNMYYFFNAAWSLIIMEVVFLFVAVYGYFRKRCFDLTVIALNLLFFYLSMKNIRFTLFFPLIWLFSMPYLLQSTGAGHMIKRSAPAALLFFLLISGACLYKSVFHSADFAGFGKKSLEDYAPTQAAEFIKKHRLPGPLYNDYTIGGYMIWAMYPEYKVFIDPRFSPYRYQVYPDNIRFKTTMASPEGLRQLNEKYPFKSALVHMKETKIANAFLQSPEWKLIYFDKIAMVFVHRSEIASLQRDALKPDITPTRFKNISNPIILKNLFDIYIAINLNHAREIFSYFKENVRDTFKQKDVLEKAMEDKIRDYEQILRKLQLQTDFRKE